MKILEILKTLTLADQPLVKEIKVIGRLEILFF